MLKSKALALCCASIFLLAPLAAQAAAEDAEGNRLLILRYLARSYEHGEGVAKDPERAAGLYCDGARQGDAEAQYSLGWMYANGRGVAKDDGIAAYFLRMAALQGHGEAGKMLRFVGEPTATEPECLHDFSYAPPDLATSPAQQQVFGLVRKLAPEYGLSPRLVMAVIRTESNFQPTAVSPKNAQGLMQLIPETAERFKVRKPFDPEQNIRGGMSYLRWLLAYFEGNVALVAAAYNAGEGAVNRHKGVPPYAETRGYVKRIMEIFKRDDHPYDPGITTPSPEMPRIRLARAS